MPKLNVDSFGKTSFSYPIIVPPGAGDVVPKLTIRYYSSPLDGGILGKSFSLEGIPIVQVNSSYGWSESNTRFISTMGGEFISDSNGFYYSKTQTSLKITRLLDGAWKIEEKNGTEYHFGTTTDSKIYAQSPDTGKVITWGLKSVRDPFGNGYDISYDSEGLLNGLLLPSSIVYVHGNGRISFRYTNETSGFISVLFNSNVRQKHSKYLSNIDVYAKDQNGSESRSESYSFDYSYDDTSRLLKTIRRANYEPLTLTYTNRSEDSLSSPWINRSLADGFSLTFRTIQEGLQSAYDTGVTACLCTANAGCMATAGPWAIAICGWATQNIWDVHVNGVETSFAGALDVNGDTIPEYVRVLGPKNDQRFYITDLSTSGDVLNSTLPIDSSPLGSPLNLTSTGRIFPGDFNGDGKSDFLIFEKSGVPIRIYWGPNFSDSYANVTSFVPPTQDKRGKHFVADMNGDGLSDFVQANASLGLEVYLSNGNTLNYSQTLSFSDYGLEFQLFADLDKNGIPDFIRMEGLPGSRRLIVTFLSCNTNVLSVSGPDAILNESGTSFGESGNRFFADTNGDGYLDFITMSSGTYIHQYHFNGKIFQTDNIWQYINNVSLLDDIGNPFLPGTYGYANYDINHDGRMDRVTRSGETGYLVEFRRGNGSYSSPILVMPNQDTYVDINEDDEIDRLRIGYFFFIVQIQVWFGPDDSYAWTDIDNNQMAIPTPTPDESASLSSMGYNNWKNKKEFTDLNRDGRADLVYYQNGQINVRLARLNSSGWVYYPLFSDYSWNSGGLLQSLDFNGDGVTELVGVSSNPQNYSDWTPSPNPVLPSILIRQVPFRSNTTLEILRFEPKVPDGLIQNIYQGTESDYHQVTKIEYDLKKNHLNSQPAGQRINPNAITPVKPNVYPFLAPEPVIKSVSSYGWDGSNEYLIAKTDYTFSTPRFFRGGLRKSSLLGYETVSSFDSLTGTNTVRMFGYSDPDLAGLETSLTISKSGNVIHSSTQNYSKTILLNGTVWVRPVSTTESIYRSGILFQSVNTTFLYDTNYNPTGKTSVIDGVSFSDVTVYDPLSFSLKPLSNTSYKDGQMTARKEFIYNGNFLSFVREKIDTNVFSESQFLNFDGYGNPTQIMDIRGNILNIEYDTMVHKFPIRVTNSFGHVSQKTYDLTRGLELTNTDSNGNIMENKYDLFGRIVAVKIPGSLDWTKTIEYTNTGSITNARAKTSYNSDENTVSWSEEIVNLKDDVTIKRGSLVNGLVLTEATYKDKAGKILRKIEPHLEGQETLGIKDYEYDGNHDLIRVTSNEGTETTILYNGYTTTTVTRSGSEIISTLIEVKNGLGQTLSKTSNGKTIQYGYTLKGDVSRILDPENGQTLISYDFSGKQTSVSNTNSGTIQYQYDTSGNLIEERYANGSRVSLTYDVLGRVLSKTATSSNGNQIHNYEYDLPSSSNGIGRLSRVTDELGTTEFSYDVRGNQTVLKKTIPQEDNLVLLLEKRYNLQNKVTDVIYPEGTKINHKYSESGYLNGITLTPNDGSTSEHPLVSYRGPLIEGNRVKIIKELGNGVWTDIYVDKITKRALETVTKSGVNVYENVAYSYDSKGNLSQIEDKMNSSRTQNFTYDELNRLTQASGKYGTENYVYTDTGKILQKGDKTFSYTDPAHTNAVTHVTSPGYIGDFGYDASGNMISRNGATLSYDGFQKMRRMDTIEQGTIEYEYDFTGTRIIKSRQIDGSKVVSLGGLYEISYQAGTAPQHTLYFKGGGGELIGQWTTQTAILRTNPSTALIPFSSEWKIEMNGKLNGIYYKSLTLLGLVRNFLRTNPLGVISGILILLILGICFVLLHSGDVIEGIQLKFLTPLTMVSMLMFVTNCNGLLQGGGGDDPPWLFAPLVLPAGTPSFNTTPTQSGNSGIPLGGSPVNGFVFFNTDHLGSVTVVMDGYGNRLGGGEWGGVSHVSYKPYGEVQRNDSQGPDIFRYKYTGQEEDRDTGLYYYKARYYDSMIGRFTQSDSILDTSRAMSMDLYMYTEGNPINHTDPSGHSIGVGTIAAVTFPTFVLPTIGAAAAVASVVAVFAVTTALSVIAISGAAASIGMMTMAAGAGLGVAALNMVGSTTLLTAGAGVATVGAVGSMSLTSGIEVIGLSGLGAGAAASTALMLGGAIAGTGLALAGVALAGLTAASFIVGCTALAVATVAGFAATGAVYTAIGLGALAIGVTLGVGGVLFASAAAAVGAALGSILSPYSLQGYLAGGVSKSSFNNIHWDEKSARLGGCYGAAITFGGLLASGPVMGGMGLISAMGWASSDSVVYQTYKAFAKTPQFGVPGTTVLDLMSYELTLYSLATGNYKGAGIDAIGYAAKPFDKGFPVGFAIKTGLKVGGEVEKGCKGWVN
ncbi:RHS repeat-associated core domain-containing protein [Leptospira interrogans]|nr:RHS repeat-associated core domain-containing protein [Leptospira interrogans]MCR8628464.1 type IV secretion protein Rhs [Leptospira interrogans serovar Canicola]OLZ32060.1 type IV secretion protein Rhs [Leptospira interrogans serovar Canicola]OQM30115.1 type IV secretion protein Rhs [Leptospira interrogans serovar Canicola str. Gui44]POR17318.1 type IV secretion protein Rhs [Leptospira interrogans serovar Canicola]